MTPTPKAEDEIRKIKQKYSDKHGFNLLKMDTAFKEIYEAGQKSSQEESFEDEEQEKLVQQYKKDFQKRSLSWDYIHELEYLLDYHVEFGQMLKKKLDTCKQAEAQRTMEVIDKWVKEHMFYEDKENPEKSYYHWIEFDMKDVKELKQELTNHSQETKHHFSLVEPDERVQMGEKSSLNHMNKTPDASNGSNSHPELNGVASKVGSGSDKNICENCGHDHFCRVWEHFVEHCEDCNCNKFTPKGDKR